MSRNLHPKVAGSPAIRSLQLEQLEDRIVPTFFGGVFVTAADVTGDGIIDIVTSPGVGGGPHIQVFDGSDGTVASTWMSSDPAFRNGATVTTGDINGDGLAEVIVGSGPNEVARVIAFDALTGAEEFVIEQPFGPAYRGGVYVASTDLNGDGRDDLIVGAMTGGSHVRAFDGKSGEPIVNFYADPSATSGGVRVAAGDVDGDGQPEIITGSGPGNTAEVRIHERDGTIRRTLAAFEPSFQGGVTVAVGDINGDGSGEIVVGAGFGGAPRLRVLDPESGLASIDQYVYDQSFSDGLYVAAADLNGDGRDDLVTGAGTGGGPHVRAFEANGSDLASFLAYDPFVLGGAFATFPVQPPLTPLPPVTPPSPPTPINTNPVAVDDSFNLQADVSTNLDVLMNDVDPDGDSLTITATTVSNNATLTTDGSVITYLPNSGFVGSDTFTYTISDNNGGIDTAEVRVVVQPTVVADLPLSFSLLEEFDSSPKGDLRTTFTHVFLKGQTEPGANVRLLPSGPQATADANGGFILRGVGLELGENVVILEAMSGSGQVAQQSLTVNRIAPLAGTIILREGENFLTSESVAVDLGPTDGSRILRFNLNAAFDRTDNIPSVEDVFLVSLVDPNDRYGGPHCLDQKCPILRCMVQPSFD